MDGLRFASVLLIAGIIFSALFYSFQPGGEAFQTVAYFIPVVFSFIAFLLGIYALRMYGLKSVQGRSILFLSLGVFCWFLGEAIWGMYGMVWGESPIVSIADIAWFAGYPLFFLGAFFAWKVGKAKLGKNEKLFMAVLSVLLFIVITVFGILPILSDSGFSPMEFAATTGYVFGDLFLLITFIVLLISLKGGEFAKPWIFISTGIILSSVADIMYYYLANSYEIGNLIDMLWVADYMLMAFGFFYYRESMSRMLKDHGESASKEAAKGKKATAASS